MKGSGFSRRTRTKYCWPLSVTQQPDLNHFVRVHVIEGAAARPSRLRSDEWMFVKVFLKFYNCMSVCVMFF